MFCGICYSSNGKFIQTLVPRVEYYHEKYLKICTSGFVIGQWAEAWKNFKKDDRKSLDCLEQTEKWILTTNYL